MLISSVKQAGRKKKEKLIGGGIHRHTKVQIETGIFYPNIIKIQLYLLMHLPSAFVRVRVRIRVRVRPANSAAAATRAANASAPRASSTARARRSTCGASG
jgi:hypothetical protein